MEDDIGNVYAGKALQQPVVAVSRRWLSGALQFGAGLEQVVDHVRIHTGQVPAIFKLVVVEMIPEGHVVHPVGPFRIAAVELRVGAGGILLA